MNFRKISALAGVAVLAFAACTTPGATGTPAAIACTAPSSPSTSACVVVAPSAPPMKSPNY